MVLFTIMLTTHVFRHCTVTEQWSGEYPYSSICNLAVENKNGKVVGRWRISTDINPRGETTLDRFLRWSKNYIPPDMKLDQLIEELVQDGMSREVVKDTLDEGLRSADFFINPNRRPFLHDLTAYPHLRKSNRQLWRECYAVRRWWKAMRNSPAHLLQFRLQGFDYLYDSSYRLWKK